MKAIKYWNTFAIGLPITLGLLGFTLNTLWYFAGLAIILTGLIQVIIGLKMLFDNPENKYLQIYAGSVGLFFITWVIDAGLDYLEILTYILVPIPFILMVYLTVIIYNYKKQ